MLGITKNVVGGINLGTYKPHLKQLFISISIDSQFINTMIYFMHVLFLFLYLFYLFCLLGVSLTILILFVMVMLAFWLIYSGKESQVLEYLQMMTISIYHVLLIKKRLVPHHYYMDES